MQPKKNTKKKTSETNRDPLLKYHKFSSRPLHLIWDISVTFSLKEVLGKVSPAAGCRRSQDRTSRQTDDSPASQTMLPLHILLPQTQNRTGAFPPQPWEGGLPWHFQGITLPPSVWHRCIMNWMLFTAAVARIQAIWPTVSYTKYQHHLSHC